MLTGCRLQRLADAGDHIPFTGEEGVDCFREEGRRCRLACCRWRVSHRSYAAFCPTLMVVAGDPCRPRSGRANRADQRGALDGDIGRGKAQGGFPRRIDGQKGNIPVLATGVSHHFTRGRMGTNSALTPQRVASRWLSSTVMPAGFPVSPRWARTALPRLMAKRSRGMVCYVTSLTLVAKLKWPDLWPPFKR